MTREAHRIDTRLIHAGEPETRICGAVSLPIFQSSTFEYAGQSSYDELKYIRMNNTPNHEVLNKKLAALENAEAAMVTASGMAAISTTLLALFSPGDHILVQAKERRNRTMPAPPCGSGSIATYALRRFRQ